jgi:hypothetical protein
MSVEAKLYSEIEVISVCMLKVMIFRCAELLMSLLESWIKSVTG